MFVPPLPGAAVRRAVGAERDHALFFDEMERTLPIGLGRDGAPLYANLDFLDGTRGAHVNISGISGVATKTTYATFLLYGLFHSGVLGAEAINTKALIFNVKGEDLLFLDHPNVAPRRRAGAAVPRPRAGAEAVRECRGLRAAAPRAIRTPGPERRPARPACRRSTGRSRTSSPASCCRSCSPTPRTSASSTRW